MTVNDQVRAAAVRSIVGDINKKLRQIDKILGYMERGAAPGISQVPEAEYLVEEVCED